MNTPRYLMPVIVAAGLHGALVYFFSDHILPPPPPTKEKPVALPDFPRMEMTREETTDPGDSGGSPSPLPPSPEIPRELEKEDIFFVPVKEDFAPIKPVTDLPKIPEGGVGHPGDGTELRGGPRGVISVIGLDRTPRATVQPAPPYPATMSSSGISGSVTVEFVVDTTGRVITAEAVRWTHREFADPAVRAVLRWRFEPGTVNGRKVSFRMAVPIEFNAER